MNKFEGKFQEASPMNKGRLYPYQADMDKYKDKYEKQINLVKMLELQETLDRVKSISISSLINPPELSENHEQA